MTAVRVLFAVLGGALAVVTSISVVRTLIIPRSRPGGVFDKGERLVDQIYRMALWRCDDYERRDQVLASKAPVILIVQLILWLVAFLVAFSLLEWVHTRDLGLAFSDTGSSMFLGFIVIHGAGANTTGILAAACGLITITLQIAYLPTLYAAFNRRETLVALLQSRAGLPPWGPELLVRTRWGIAGDRDDLPAFFSAWEGWAADVAESHSNYPILVQFRSPRPLTSWLIGLLAVLDSAALLLATSPSRDRIEPRLCLRMGFTALQQVADSLGIPYDADPDPDSDIQLSYAEFEMGIQRLLDVGFEVERDAEAAWPHFRGWRVNYESIAYALAYRIDAVPTYWSGPRSWTDNVIAPKRPPARRPKDTSSGKQPSVEAT